jgi:hypothetical protein
LLALRAVVRSKQAAHSQTLPDPRSRLQYALDNLNRRPDSPNLQKTAHEKVLEFSNAPRTQEDINGVLHQAAATSINSGLGYGARNVIKQAIDRAHPAAEGLTEAMIGAGINIAANPLGIVAGQATNSYLVAPNFTNQFSVQQEPIPTNAILPDAMKKEMNDLRPGAGNELSEKIDTSKKDAANPQTYGLAAQTFYAMTATANAAAQKTVQDPLVQALYGSAAPAAAGAALGAVIGSTKATTKATVPKQDDLTQLKETLSKSERERDVESQNQPPNATPAQMKALVEGGNGNKASIYYPRVMSPEDIQDKNIAAANARPATLAGTAESMASRYVNTAAAIAPANVIASTGAILSSELMEPGWASGQAPIAHASSGVGIATAMPFLQKNTARGAARDKEIRSKENVPAAVPNRFIAGREYTIPPEPLDALEAGLQSNQSSTAGSQLGQNSVTEDLPVDEIPPARNQYTGPFPPPNPPLNGPEDMV